jgi:thioredoxin reductase
LNRWELIVIGSGPSGLTAAIEAAKNKVKVLLIDENIKAGGQLFKQIHKFFGSIAHYSGIRGLNIGENLLKKAEEEGVKVLLNRIVIGLFKGKKVVLKQGLDNKGKNIEIFEADKIVIASGATENTIYFSGWTLPGVMSAGAIQTMINVHRVLPGKKILMVGSGNVGLIVSYQLIQAGAEVKAVIEALPKIGGYEVHAAKIRRLGVPIYTSHTIVEAKGNLEVEEAVIAKVNRNWEIIPNTEKILKVDTISIAAGLEPLIKLVRMAGCKCIYIPELGGWVPIHNKNMETTCSGIYVAGDVTGVEEANTALEEGRLAGIAVAESLGYLDKKIAFNIKTEISERLKDLRSGPFGESRQKAKNKIVREYQILNRKQHLSVNNK